MGLGQTGEGLHLTVVSDEETHRLAPSMAFVEDSVPYLLLRNNSDDLTLVVVKQQ